MEVNPTRMCELLIGLPDVNVLGVVDGPISQSERALPNQGVEHRQVRRAPVPRPGPLNPVRAITGNSPDLITEIPHP